jgi:hypothetical protein
VKSIEVVIVGADIDHPVGNRRRGLDAISCLEGPVSHQSGDVGRTDYLLTGIQVCMLGIKTEHRKVGVSRYRRIGRSRSRSGRTTREERYLEFA